MNSQENTFIDDCRQNIIRDMDGDELNVNHYILASFAAHLGYSVYDRENVRFTSDGILLNPSDNVLIALYEAEKEKDIFDSIKEIDPSGNAFVVHGVYKDGSLSFYRNDKMFLSFNSESEDIGFLSIIGNKEGREEAIIKHINSMVDTSDVVSAIETMFDSPDDELVALISSKIELEGDVIVQSSDVIMAYKKIISSSLNGESSIVSSENPVVVECDENNDAENDAFEEIKSFIGFCFNAEDASNLKIRHGKAYSNVMFENNRKSIARIHMSGIKNPFAASLESSKETVRMPIVDSFEINNESFAKSIIGEMISFGCINNASYDDWLGFKSEDNAVEDVVTSVETQDSEAAVEDVVTSVEAQDDEASIEEAVDAQDNDNHVMDDSEGNEKALNSSYDINLDESSFEDSIDDSDPFLSTGDDDDVGF